MTSASQGSVTAPMTISWPGGSASTPHPMAFICGMRPRGDGDAGGWLCRIHFACREDGTDGGRRLHVHLTGCREGVRGRRVTPHVMAFDHFVHRHEAVEERVALPPPCGAHPTKPTPGHADVDGIATERESEARREAAAEAARHKVPDQRNLDRRGRFITRLPSARLDSYRQRFRLGMNSANVARVAPSGAVPRRPMNSAHRSIMASIVMSGEVNAPS